MVCHCRYRSVVLFILFQYFQSNFPERNHIEMHRPILKNANTHTIRKLVLTRVDFYFFIIHLALLIVIFQTD